MCPSVRALFFFFRCADPAPPPPPQARILRDHYQLNASAFPSVLRVLRAEGARRENARKNVGLRAYAFNKLQCEMLPKEYRPPAYCTGKVPA